MQLAGHNPCWWIEDSPGYDAWLSSGWISDKEAGRFEHPRRGRPHLARLWIDSNRELDGIVLTAAVTRPSETDVDRVLWALTTYYNADPRLSTVIENHLVPATNTIAMPSKTYDAGTAVIDILRDCAETAGKTFGVVIHDQSSASHKCLQYTIPTDYTTYACAAKISDDWADWDPFNADHAGIRAALAAGRGGAGEQRRAAVGHRLHLEGRNGHRRGHHRIRPVQLLLRALLRRREHHGGAGHRARQLHPRIAQVPSTSPTPRRSWCPPPRIRSSARAWRSRSRARRRMGGQPSARGRRAASPPWSGSRVGRTTGSRSCGRTSSSTGRCGSCPTDGAPRAAARPIPQPPSGGLHRRQSTYAYEDWGDGVPERHVVGSHWFFWSRRLHITHERRSTLATLRPSSTARCPTTGRCLLLRSTWTAGTTYTVGYWYKSPDGDMPVTAGADAPQLMVMAGAESVAETLPSGRARGRTTR